MYFNDGLRTIDFVIVWTPDDDILIETQRNVKRAVFEENLINEGLDLEIETVDDDLNFVKVLYHIFVFDFVVLYVIYLCFTILDSCTIGSFTKIFRNIKTSHAYERGEFFLRLLKGYILYYYINYIANYPNNTIILIFSTQ